MTNAQIHLRSISFPSRLLHPTSFKTQVINTKLKSCEVDHISSEAIVSGLLDLTELYKSVQKLTQSINYAHQASIEESLSGSVELLDACSAIKELFQMIKENVHALQSAMRRKGLESNSNVQSDINSYICFRKRMSKCVSKTLRKLKSLESNRNGSSDHENDGFGELAVLTIATFKSTLGFLACPAGRSGGWNLVSRLMIAKSADRPEAIGEVGCVDSVLGALIRNGDSNKGTTVDLQMVLRSLQNLDDCIEGIELGLQRLFRQLLQCRVTLLNVVTHH